MIKKGFTLLELVFVIVVIGILAVAILPRMGRDNVAEATIALQSHLRYTQHLAFIDDRLDPDDATWADNRWRIEFDDIQYSVLSGNTAARDPQNPNNTLANVSLGNFGITSVTFTGGCAGSSHITFDYLGRPLVNAGAIMNQVCVITIGDGSESGVIRIHPETGYVQGI